MASNVYTKKNISAGISAMSLGSGLARILLLLSALQLPGCASESPVADANRNARGLRAKLIHKDHFAVHSFGNAASQYRPRSERIFSDAEQTARRVEAFQRAAQKKTTGDGSDSADFETPLSDAADYEYLMAISLGTPPQEFVAVADTGSDLTWVQCLQCENCYPQVDAYFDPTLSSTIGPLPCSSAACEFLSTYATCPYSPTAPDGEACPYTYGYADGSSTTGNLVEDVINLETLTGGVQTIPNFWFGCSHSATSSSGLYDAADGLVGLGGGVTSFPSQLGKYFGSVFGYCLVDRTGDVVEDSPLIFGDAAVPPLQPGNGPQIQYTPFNDSGTSPLSSTFYFVNLESILLGGVALPISRDAFLIRPDGTGGTIFDSGTTYTSLVTEAYNALVEGLSDAITGYATSNAFLPYFKLCYIASWEEWAAQYGTGTPVISFSFAEAAPYDLEVDAAWIELDVGTICLAILDSGFSSGNIIGNFQQTDFQLVYDLEHRQLGFLPTDCNLL